MLPSEDSAAVLVARFLRTNNYEETLAAFLIEANLPLDTGLASSGDLTIEKILDEKRVFDVTLNFEKVGIDDGSRAWSIPAPSVAIQVETLHNSSNLLFASVEKIKSIRDGTENVQDLILATAADKSINLLSAITPFTTASVSVGSSFFDAPTLCCSVISERFVVATSMSGRVIVYDLVAKKQLDDRRDHMKYIVKVVHTVENDGIWIATAGWDAKVLIYHVSSVAAASGDFELGEAVTMIELASNPEALLFIKHPEIETPVLILSRRDSTFLYYYTFLDRPSNDSTESQKTRSSVLLGKQNLAPHSNAWIAFTPSALAVSPIDPTLLAVATSAVPHLKLVIVRLLLPPSPPRSSIISTSLPPIHAEAQNQQSHGSHQTQASQARAELAVQDREAAAITVHANTLAPQTAYSTPALAWRPDGSGIWVNGDDGVVRGIEAKSGKVIVSLTGGHELGSKIRCMWAGWVEVEGEREEWVVSGGFDKRLVVWKAGEQGE